MRSDREAQKKRPPMLNSDSKPVKPAATVAIAAFCSPLRSLNATSTPLSLPANTSCNIGDAMPIIPIPAVTFRHSTAHTSQNWWVFHATFRCTWLAVIMDFLLGGGGVQPAG